MAEVLDEEDCSSSASDEPEAERERVPPMKQKRKSKGLISSLLGAFSSSSASSSKRKPKKKRERRRRVDRSASVLRQEAQQGRAIHREADTNVVSIEFGSLAQDSRDIFAGDAVFCSSCKAVLSRTSVLVPVEYWDEKTGDTRKGDDNIQISSVDDAKDDQAEELSGTCVWKCEFCGTVNNEIELDDEEIPKEDARDYVLEPATEDDDKKQQNDGLTIFCVDVSGSMVSLLRQCH